MCASTASLIFTGKQLTAYKLPVVLLIQIFELSLGKGEILYYPGEVLALYIDVGFV